MADGASEGRDELKLIGFWVSPFVHRVQVALHLKRITRYEYVERRTSPTRATFSSHPTLCKRRSPCSSTAASPSASPCSSCSTSTTSSPAPAPPSSRQTPTIAPSRRRPLLGRLCRRPFLSFMEGVRGHDRGGEGGGNARRRLGAGDDGGRLRRVL